MKPKAERSRFWFGISEQTSSEEVDALWPHAEGPAQGTGADSGRAGLVYDFLVHGQGDVVAWEEYFELEWIRRRGPKRWKLRIHLADQAALYGAISRVRELGLVLVEAKPARLPRAPRKPGSGPRFDWQGMIVYLLAIGAMTPFVVFISRFVSVALVLTMFFAALAVLAEAFYVQRGGWAWHLPGGSAALAAFITLTIYLPQVGIPVEVALGILFGVPGVLIAAWLLRRPKEAPAPTPTRQTITAYEVDGYTLEGVDGDLARAAWEIRVRGRLESPRWLGDFDGLRTEVQADGSTLILATLTSADLVRLLALLRDRALPLLGLRRLE